MNLTEKQLARVAAPFRNAVLSAMLDSERGVKHSCRVCMLELNSPLTGLADVAWASAAKVQSGRLHTTVDDAFIRQAFAGVEAVAERLAGQAYHMKERRKVTSQGG